MIETTTIEVPVNPFHYDGMRSIGIPVKVDHKEQMIYVDFMSNQGTKIMETFLSEVGHKFPGYEIRVARLDQ
jgi:cystathionine beta-lyase family protein involved in aluminum resistance